MLIQDYAERFWKRVLVGDTEECWPWQRWRTAKGHGRFSVWDTERKCVVGLTTSRIAWELTNGPIPDGLFVLHRCPGGDNPACCNPSHLYLGTQRDNMRDRRERGDGYKKQAKGSEHPMAKLDEVRVLALLQARSEGATLRLLAERFGVDITQVSHIVRREHWSHVSFDGVLPNRCVEVRTHCIHGHSFDEENTQYDKDGYRVCRACRHASLARWRARQKAGRTADRIPRRDA
jgi:hypothetical protein